MTQYASYLSWSKCFYQYLLVNSSSNLGTENQCSLMSLHYGIDALPLEAEIFLIVNGVSLDYL